MAERERGNPTRDDMLRAMTKAYSTMSDYYDRVDTIDEELPSVFYDMGRFIEGQKKNRVSEGKTLMEVFAHESDT